MIFGIAIATLVLLMGCSSDQIATDPMELVQNERTFAADVAANGMRDGFLAHIADDGVLFIPQAVNGKTHYEAQEKRPGHLTWFPIYAEISSGGDMGWTTGPWEWRASAADSLAQASGQYNTIWVRQPDSTWKFAFDMGTAHHAHQGPVPVLATRVLDRPESGIDLTFEQAQIELVQMERNFSSASANDGQVAAYIPRMANDVRINRQGEYPVVGVADATAALSRADGRWTWKTNHADISPAGDLAYTFGVTNVEYVDRSEQFSYGRIWRRGDDGAWRLAMDIHILLPPPATPAEEETDG